MKKIIGSSLLACTMLSNVAVANNIDVGKTYVKVGVGTVFYDDNDGKLEDSGNTWGYDFDFKKTEAYNIGVGYKINKYLTTELTYQKNNNMKFSGNEQLDGVYVDDKRETNLKTSSIMINALFDIETIFKKDWKINPYIGLGIGYAKHKMDNLASVYNESYFIGDESTSLSYKAILGATYPINKKFFIDTSYSYVDYGTAKITNKFVIPSLNISADIGTPMEVDVKSQELFLSLRYVF